MLNSDLDEWYFVWSQSWRSSWRWNKAWMKYHISKSELSVWFIQLSTYFYQIYIYIYIHKYIKLLTIVESKPIVPFSLATIPSCWGGCDSFPWIAPLNPWSVPNNAEVKKGGIKYSLLSLWFDSTWERTPVSWAICKHSTH